MPFPYFMKNTPVQETTQPVTQTTTHDSSNKRESDVGVELAISYQHLSEAEQQQQQQPPQRDATEVRTDVYPEGGEASTFRTMNRRHAVFVLISNQVGLGILSLPSVMHILGVVPGCIIIVSVGFVATYTAYQLLQLYRKYPHCANIVDMAREVGGQPFELIMGIALMFKICMTCASAAVTLSVGFNTISGHAMCTAWWIGVSCVLCWLLCLPRTFKFVAHVGIPAAISIFVAILIVVISLALGQPRGALLTPDGHILNKEIRIFGNPDFKQGMRAFLNICYAYAGNVGYPSMFPEMKRPSRDFIPAMLWLQVFSIPLYLFVAISIYLMAGQYTTSPALGSAPELAAKVAYGLAIPAVLSTGLVFGHTAIKYMYVVMLRELGAQHLMTSHMPIVWMAWIAAASGFWVTAYVLGNSIPIFDSILSISGATFVAWFTFGAGSIFWFHLNRGKLLSSWRKIFLTVANVLLLSLMLLMNVGGLWASISNLVDIFQKREAGIEGPFTCADNSLF